MEPDRANVDEHATTARPARNLGVGIGLRVPHYRAIHAGEPAVDFFEIISETFMVAGGRLS